MNPLKSPFKRTTTVLVGAAIGLTGAMALAAPASAHHTTITGVTACTATGDWKVTWTVVNSEARKVATIKELWVAPIGDTVDGVAIDGEIPAGGQIVGTQNLGKSDPNATLGVFAKWLTKEDGQPDPRPPAKWNYGSVSRPGYCPSTPPTTIAPTTPTTPPPTSKPATTEPTPTPTPTTKAPATSAPPTTAAPASVAPSPTADVPGAGGNEPTLPKTGVAVGGIAGGAALLLAVGAGLFFLARRRKLKFTA